MLDCTSADTLWLASLRAGGRSPATIASYAYALRQLREWRQPEAGDDLLTVTRLEVMAFAKHLTETYQPQGNVSRFKSLKAFFNWCLDEELITASPVARVKMSAPSIAQPVPTDQDVQAMFDRAKRSKNPRRDTALLAVLVCTGARKGELANVEVADVDLHSGIMRLRVSKSRARQVPLDDKAVAAVGKWMRQRGVGPGSLWSVSDPYQLIDNVMVRLSNGQWRSHALRRYFATTWLRRGGSEVSLVRIAGWSSGAQLRHYVSASADVLSVAEYRRVMA